METVENLIKNHWDLIRLYAFRKQINLDDHQDILAIALYSAAKDYCEKESARQYAFQAIAYTHMRNNMCIYVWRKNKVKLYSLDAPIKGTDGLTLGDYIPDEAPDLIDQITADEAACELLETALSMLRGELRYFLLMHIQFYFNRIPMPQRISALHLKTQQYTEYLNQCREQLKPLLERKRL